MIGLLRLVPIWAYALVAALAWGGWQKYQATQSAAELVRHIAETAELREKAMHGALIETTRRLNAQQEVSNRAQASANAARSAAASAATASERLRAHAASLAASSATCNPSSTTVSAAERLAGVLAESVERYRTVAEAADRAIISGSECSGRYDALVGKEKDK